MPLPFVVPATISRYIGLSFITMTLVWLVAVAVGMRWSVTAPVIFGLAGAVLSVHLPALLFAKTQRREFLPEEELAFLAGSFSAVWFYDGFLGIVAHTLHHDAWSLMQILRALEATAVDFALVWAMVFYSVPMIAWLLFLRATEVSATVSIFSKPDTCSMHVAGRAPPRFDVPCSEVAMTLAQLGVPRGSAVFLQILAAITKEQSAALHKQIEDAGYVIAKVK